MDSSNKCNDQKKPPCRVQIAELVCCGKSTVSRELRRNCDQRDGSYWPDLAQRKANVRHKSKPKRRRFTANIEACVREKLEADYSPEQIAGGAARKGTKYVSHEHIYKLVWDDNKQGGKLYRHMRTRIEHYAKRDSPKGKGAKLSVGWTLKSVRRLWKRSSGWAM